MANMRHEKPKRVLITGGTGSFGKTMLRDLLNDDIQEVRIISRDEEKQDALRNDLRDDRVRYYIGDVRDRGSVDHAVRGVDAIFHAAALKQVPSCEFFPHEAVLTNIIGSENVIKSAIASKVRSVVCLSTDMVNDISLLTGLMIIGISFRSLNLGWMAAMTGRGDAKHFTPWLLPGAIGNATVLVSWGLFAPETFSVVTVGWVFLGFQVLTHGAIIPVVSARSFGYPLQNLIAPLLVPFGIAVATYLVAYGLSLTNHGGSNELRIAIVFLTASLGVMANLFIVMRRGNLE